MISTKNPQKFTTSRKKKAKTIKYHDFPPLFQKVLEPNHPLLFVKQIFPKNTWPWRGHTIPVGHFSLPFTWIFWAPQKRWRAASKLARAKWRLERLTGCHVLSTPLKVRVLGFCLGGGGTWMKVSGRWNPPRFFLFTKKKRKNFGGLNKILLFFGNRMEYLVYFNWN